MSSKVKLIFGIMVLICIIAGSAYAYGYLSDRIDKPGNMAMESEGVSGGVQRDKAIDFSMVDKDGNRVRLSDFEGKPVVLNFWASWCPPCKEEMPYFETVFKDLGNEIEFIMLDLVDGSRETKEIGAAYIEEQEFTFPVYFDVDQDGAYAYGIRSIPTTIFIDKDGYVVTGAQGAIDEETLRKAIEMIK